jgi:hypothetical protein
MNYASMLKSLKEKFLHSESLTKSDLEHIVTVEETSVGQLEEHVTNALELLESIQTKSTKKEALHDELLAVLNQANQLQDMWELKQRYEAEEAERQHEQGVKDGVERMKHSTGDDVFI